MGLKLITAPASTPVSLSEVKSYMRELTTDQDTLFTSLIAAATSYLDGPNGYLGRAIITQTWELYLDDFSSAIRIPFGPVASVTSVKYYDTAGSLQTIDSANYAVDLTSSDQWIVPVSTYSWPAVASGINNVIIRFVAGEATAPEAIKAAIHMLIAQWFEMPEASSDKPVTELPHAVSALLANFREYGFGA
jgi:uncharacterized phiE125 gp8 family phage protein